MDIEVLEKTVTSTVCEVRVGKMYFVFQITPNRGVWKTGESYYSSSRPFVSKKDFLEARRQAGCAIRSKESSTKFKERTGAFEPNEDALSKAFRWGHTYYPDAPPPTVITEWLIQTGRWSTANEKTLRSLVAVRAASTRAKGRSRNTKEKEIEVERERQYTLPI